MVNKLLWSILDELQTNFYTYYHTILADIEDFEEILSLSLDIEVDHSISFFYIFLCCFAIFVLFTFYSNMNNTFIV